VEEQGGTGICQLLACFVLLKKKHAADQNAHGLILKKIVDTACSADRLHFLCEKNIPVI